MFLSDWTYDGGDPGLRLFTLANAKLPDVPAPDIFEIGCADTDFMDRARHAEPTAIVGGLDWRTTKEDALTAPFDPWDVVVSISTIEHIGLGHYEMDPIDPYGDIKVVQRVRDTLRSGGFFYFDVPYAPEGYWVLGTKCRVYDDQSLIDRFGPHEVLGYTLPSADGWIEKPTTNHQGSHPFYYVALLVRKDA